MRQKSHNRLENIGGHQGEEAASSFGLTLVESEKTGTEEIGVASRPKVHPYDRTQCGKTRRRRQMRKYFSQSARLAGSRPLEQQRRAGLWPESFDEMWQALNVRHGKQDGTRQMIDLLKLAKQNGHGRLRAAIETALATGCTDGAAVQHLFHAPDLSRTPCEAIDIGSLERYQRPLPVMNEYDQLLVAGGPR